MQRKKLILSENKAINNHIMFKLGQCAEKKWRKLKDFDYLVKVFEEIQFKDGIEVIPEIRIAA